MTSPAPGRAWAPSSSWEGRLGLVSAGQPEGWGGWYLGTQWEERKEGTMQLGETRA